MQRSEHLCNDAGIRGEFRNEMGKAETARATKPFLALRIAWRVRRNSGGFALSSPRNNFNG